MPPHLDFAVCVEGELPCQYNYASKELEFFNANAGVWMHTGGQAYCRGELLKDALCKVLCTPRWGLDKDGKTRLLPGDDPLFHTAPVLSSVGGMLDKVTPDLSLPLMRRLVNFKGPYCLEFSDPPHVTAASADEELLNALAMCVRAGGAAPAHGRRQEPQGGHQQPGAVLRAEAEAGRQDLRAAGGARGAAEVVRGGQEYRGQAHEIFLKLPGAAERQKAWCGTSSTRRGC